MTVARTPGRFDRSGRPSGSADEGAAHPRTRAATGSAHWRWRSRILCALAHAPTPFLSAAGSFPASCAGGHDGARGHGASRRGGRFARRRPRFCAAAGKRRAGDGGELRSRLRSDCRLRARPGRTARARAHRAALETGSGTCGGAARGRDAAAAYWSRGLKRIHDFRRSMMKTILIAAATTIAAPALAQGTTPAGRDAHVAHAASRAMARPSAAAPRRTGGRNAAMRMPPTATAAAVAEGSRGSPLQPTRMLGTT